MEDVEDVKDRKVNRLKIGLLGFVTCHLWGRVNVHRRGLRGFTQEGRGKSRGNSLGGHGSKKERRRYWAFCMEPELAL